MVRSVAAGAPPSTSMVIDPLAVAPVQFVLLVMVFCVIAGVTLTSFTVNKLGDELQRDVVLVATTLGTCRQRTSHYCRCTRSIDRYARVIKPLEGKACRSSIRYSINQYISNFC